MFSVVIPLYNKRNEIADTLRSVVSQSLRPAEIIVVDDGSDDGSLEIVRSFDCPELRILSTGHPRSGPSAARNVGIKAATQEWVSFLDADDTWAPTHLEKIKGLIGQADATTIGAFAAWKWDWSRSGTPAVKQTRINPFAAKRSGVGKLNLRSFLKAWLEDEACPICSSACTFRKSALLKAGMFDEGARRGEDKQLWLKLLALGEAAYTVEPLATYYLGIAGQLTSTSVSTDLHVVCSAADALRAQQPPETQVLLDRLYNLVIWQYAVHLRLSQRLPRAMFQGFRIHLNPIKYAILLALSIVPTGIQRPIGATIMARRA